MEDKINWAKPPQDGIYDGKRFDRFTFDEPGQWQEAPPIQIYMLQFQISDVARSNDYPMELRTRPQMLKELEYLKKDGWESHCCFNLDGTIDLKLQKETEYFGTRVITGSVKKYKP